MLTEDDFAASLNSQPEPQPAQVSQPPVTRQVAAEPAPRQRMPSGIPAQTIDLVLGSARKNGVDPAVLFSVARDVGINSKNPQSELDNLAANLAAAIKRTNSTNYGLTSLFLDRSNKDAGQEVRAAKKAASIMLEVNSGAFANAASKYDAKTDQYKTAAKEYFDSLLQAKDGEDAKRIAQTTGVDIFKRYGFDANDAYLLDKQVGKLYKNFQFKIANDNAVAGLPREVDNLAGRYPNMNKSTGDFARDTGLAALQSVVGLGKQGFGLVDMFRSTAAGRVAKEVRDWKNSEARRTSTGQIGGGASGHRPEIAAPEPTLGNAILGNVPASQWADKALGLTEVQQRLEAEKTRALAAQKTGFHNTPGAIDKALFLLQNPAVAADAATQSVAPMLVMGAGVGSTLRGLKGEELLAAATARSAAAEGLQTTADAAYDHAKDGEYTTKERVADLAAGTGTGAISLGVGKLMPGMDTDALIATMFTKEGKQVLAPGAAAKELVKKTFGSTAENAVEEFAQSGQERGWQNWADGKPISTGVVEDAILGAASGGLMGAAGGAVSTVRNTKLGKAPTEAPSNVEAEIAAALAELNAGKASAEQAKAAAASDVQALNKNQQPLLPEPKEVTEAKQAPDFSKVSDDQLKYLATQHPDPAVRSEVMNIWEARKLAPENFTLGEKLDTGPTPVAEPAAPVDDKTLDMFDPANAPATGQPEQKDILAGWQPAAPVETQTDNAPAAPAINPQQGELDLGTRRQAEWQKPQQEVTPATQQVETAVTPDVAENQRLAAERNAVLAMPVKDAMDALGVPKQAQVVALRQAQKSGVATGRDLVNAFQSEDHPLSMAALQNGSGKWRSDLGNVLEEKLNEWSYANQQAQQDLQARAPRETNARVQPAQPLTLPENQTVRKLAGKPGVFQVVQKPTAKVAPEVAPATTAPKPAKADMWAGLVPPDAGTKLSVDETAQMDHQTKAADIEAALRGHPTLGTLLGALLDSGHISISESLASNPKAAGSDEGGKINLYTSRLPSGRAVAVTVHEAVHTALERHLGKNGFARLIKQLTTMEQAARNGTGEVSQFFKDAAKRIPANTPEEHRGEELGAYAVQRVMEGKAPKGVVAWVKNLMAQIKAAMFKLTGGRIGTVDEKMLHQLTVQALRGWAAQSAVQDQTATAKAAEDPERVRQTWNDVWQNDAGPEYYGNDFALIATHDYGQIEHDFVDSPKGVPAWQLGHAASVNPENRAAAFHIAGRDGAPAGSMLAEVSPQGQIEAIHDLQILPELRNGGLGSTIVKQIAANAPGEVRILEAKDEAAQRFWTRNGAGYYDPYKNSSLSWESHQATAQRGANQPRVAAEPGATGPNEDGKGPVTKYSENTEDGIDYSALTNEDLAQPSVVAGVMEKLGYARDAYEQFQTLRDFVAKHASTLPSLAPWSKTLFEQSAASNELMQLGNETMAAVNDLGMAQAKNLLGLMQQESFHGVFADQKPPATAAEEERIAQARLEAQFNKLSPEAKAAYTKVRSALQDQWTRIHDALRTVVVSTIHDPVKQREALNEINKRYNSTKGKPYFPLQRHGQYIVVGYDADGSGSNIVASYDAKRDADAAARAMTQRGVKRVNMFVRPSPESFDRNAVPSAGLLNDLHSAIDSSVADDADRQAMHLALQNLYLQALPEFSGAKKMLGRSAKPIMGFDADARRALAVSLFSGARYASQLEYAPQLNAQMRDMEAEAKGRVVPHVFVDLTGTPTVKVFTKSEDVRKAAAAYTNKPGSFAVFDGGRQDLATEIPEQLKQMRENAQKLAARSRKEDTKRDAQHIADVLSDDAIAKVTKDAEAQAAEAMPALEDGITDRTEAQRVLEEVKRRNASRAAASYGLGGKIQRGTLTASYINYLGLNVSTALNNTAQVPLITLPYMGAKLGYATATKQLAKYGAKAAATIIPHLASELHNWGRASPLVIDRVPGLNQGQKDMLKEAQAAGLLDYTVAADLANVVHNTSEVADRGMRLMGAFNHWGEVWNRVSTALAAYDGYNEKHGDNHAKASAFVQDVLAKTHGDYSQLNAAPIMNATRHPNLIFLTQFGKFPLTMFELQKNLVMKAFAGDRTAKIEALKALGGMYATAYIAAGPLATPFASTFAVTAQSITNALKDADDDEFDIRTWWKNQWDSKDIPEWAQAFMVGGISRMLGAENASRVGTGDILPVVKLDQTIPKPNESAAAKIARSTADYLGGAAFSTMAQAAAGAGQLAEDWGDSTLEGAEKLRGALKLLPKFLSNIGKAAALSSKGLDDNKGGTIIKPSDLSTLDIANQAMGFTPSKVADHINQTRNIINDAAKAADRAKELVRDYVAAEQNGDAVAMNKAEEALKRFQAHNPYSTAIKSAVSTVISAPAKDRAWRDATDGEDANRTQMLQRKNSEYHDQN